MHQRLFSGRLTVALMLVIMALAAGAATAQACPSGTLTPGSTVGQTSCPALSGPTFQQSGYCFYFPNGSADAPSLCDPSFCGQVSFLFPVAGTFTATLTYPSPNGFNLLGLQLCHNGQPVPDPATCSQTMSPGGADTPGCTTDSIPGDNGTPLDPTDDTMTTTLTCPIFAGDSINQYTLIVYAIAVMNCTDVMDPLCAADFNNGVTGALQASFDGTVTQPGPTGAKAAGGGEVAPKQNFSLNAQNDPAKWDHAHIRFAIASNDPTKCKFEADGANYVDIEPTPLAKSGGSGLISGNGVVTDWLKIKHNVAYTLRITDGGKNGTDTFQLSAPGCDTNGLAVPVTHGNIEIHPGHDNH